MGLYDEPYDITYLHDSDPRKKRKPDSDSGGFKQLLKSKQIVVIVFITASLLGTGLLVLNLASPKDTRTRAIENIPGEKKATVIKGTVKCASKEDSECELAIVTDEGKQYVIEQSEETEGLKQGDEVSAEGTIVTSPNNSVIVVKKITATTIPHYKTPTPAQNQTQTPQISVSQEDLPEPTPTPQVLKNNTPNPGIEYFTVSYILQNKDSLLGSNVNVRAYLVGGYIGIPGCDFEPNCNHSQFLLSDFNSADRDTSLDILYLGGTDDKEGDYAPGQDFYTEVKVLQNGDTVYLEKVN